MAGSFKEVNLPEVLVFRQNARDELKLQLESLPGHKDLVIDSDLMRPLDRLAGASFLKEHGVDKIFKLEPSIPTSGSDQRIYIVRPHSKLIKIIADQINNEQNAGISRSYKLLLIPRKLYKCEKLLEREGVWGLVSVEELQIDLVPLDQDILSLELPEFLNTTYLDGDQTWIHTAARSLATLQQQFGAIPNTYVVGHCAQMTHELAQVMLEGDEASQVNGEIGSVFIFDRTCDFVTPLLSQVTYEGLLDDMFGIKSGYIEFPPQVSGKDSSVKMVLTSSDLVYEEVRNRHFSNVFGFLSMKAKELQTGYDKRHDLKSVRDMKDYVAKDLKGLKLQHKSLALHVGACEHISNSKTKMNFDQILQAEHTLVEGIEMKENISFIEESIHLQNSSLLCLRLLCLMSLTQGGLSDSMYKSLQTQYAQSFGFDALIKFHNLKKLGLFTEVEQSNTSRNLSKMAAVVNIPRSCPFRVLCKKLNLIPKSADDVDLRSPNDMSYVFSGAYSPVLCRLVEQVLTRDGFKGMEDTMKLFPGPYFSDKKGTSVKGGAAGMKKSQVVAVFFLGGCTYSEISALRFLGKQRGIRFLVVTTSLFNGNSFLQQVADK